MENGGDVHCISLSGCRGWQPWYTLADSCTVSGAEGSFWRSLVALFSMTRPHKWLQGETRFDFKSLKIPPIFQIAVSLFLNVFAVIHCNTGSGRVHLSVTLMGKKNNFLTSFWRVVSGVYICGRKILITSIKSPCNLLVSSIVRPNISVYLDGVCFDL